MAASTGFGLMSAQGNESWATQQGLSLPYTFKYLEGKAQDQQTGKGQALAQLQNLSREGHLGAVKQPRLHDGKRLDAVVVLVVMHVIVAVAVAISMAVLMLMTV